MIVVFDKNNRESIRIYAEETEEQKREGIEINEEDVPRKDGYRTVIYKKNDKEVEYKFEEIIEEKSEVELLKEELEQVKLEYASSIAEIIDKTEKDKLELSTAIVELMEQSIK